MSMLSVACTQNSSEHLGEGYHEGTDWQSNFGAGSLPQIQRAGNGYYFLMSEYLYYYDKSMEQAVPVCSKADCNHSAADCNAYMGDASEINYYDDKIYFIASENGDSEKWFLYSISEDGRQREKVDQVATLESTDMGISFEFCVHRGYAYFSASKGAALKKRKAQVWKVPLRGGKWSEVASVEGYGAKIEDIGAYGNTLVVVGYYAASVNSDFRTHTNFVQLQSGKEQKDVLFDEKRDVVFIHKDKQDVYYYDDQKLYRLNTNTKEKTNLTGERTIYVDCCFDGKYFYSCNWSDCREKGDFRNYRIDVYDMKGKRIGEIPLKENMDWQYGDKTFCFAYSLENETYTMHYFDKEKLLEEHTGWEKLLVLRGETDGSGKNLLE